MFTETSIPRGLCQCGCGGVPPPAPYNSVRRQWVKGEPVRFIKKHHPRRPLWQFMARYTHPEPMSGCWLWTGPTSLGYGQVTQNYKHLKAHNIAYQLLVGPIPQGLILDHLCRTPACVNPDHLEPVTNGENVRRGLSSTQLLAKFRAQTHCKHGHEFTPENTYIYVHRGWKMRHCRQCANQRARLYRKANEDDLP